MSRILAILDALAGMIKLVKEAVLGIRLNQSKNEIEKANTDAKQTKDTSEIDTLFKN